MQTQKMFYVLVFSLFALSLSAQKEFNQTEFKVEVSGKGQPVLLFPGFTATGKVYEDLVKVLSKNYEVHTFTFAGFGNVPPIDTPWLSKIKTGVENYIAEKKLKKPIIIGHSMGGTLGIWLASEKPELFSKLIVIDALPAMGAMMMPDYKSENITYDNPYNDKLLKMDDSEFKKMAEQMATSMCLNTEKQKQLEDWILQADRRTFVYGYTDLLKLDLRNNLKKITIPVLILGATYPYGKEVAEANYRKQYKFLKDYKLKFAEGSAHFIMYDKPQWFLDQIKSELGIQ